MERREGGPREPGESGAGRRDVGEASGTHGEEQATWWRSFRLHLRRRARGRRWRWPRLLLLLGLAWILKEHLGDPAYASLFGGINLAIHEAGHLALGWFGTTPGILGGTIFELGAPLAAGAAFHRQRDDFAV
ncbi:MAG: hypothetical protein GWN82_18825, partial [Gemmatimonadetes bacterium]|nr:hypothetical protein [Gemmatimonadota bacterium]NIU32682.1 hypothetical protein [Gemmatimonadota bacterium]NIW65768.1 hypothetical protein [Gemmatimonadota bacterium]